eukprot:gene3064-3611_t
MLSTILFCTHFVRGAVTGGVFNVKDYGASGSGTTDDTKAVRATFSAAAVAGGGAVVFPPPGRYLTGPFNLSSNVHVDVQIGATVLGIME